MRILMICDFYWPYIGGVEQHVRSLSHELVARGHEVAIATLWSEGQAEFEQDGAVRVHRIRSTTQYFSWLFSHPGRPWAPPCPDPNVTRSLRAILRRERPNLVHGHDWLARSFLPLKRSSGAKFVVSLHYYTLSCAKKSLMHRDHPCTGPGAAKCLRCASEHYGVLKGTAVTLANWASAWSATGAVDYFIAVSRKTADGNELAMQHVPYDIIPNFIPRALDVKNSDVDEYVEQLPDEPFLMFVGDLRRNKGIHVLLDAYERLSSPPPLVLIGKLWAESPTSFPSKTVILKNWPNYAVMAAWSRSMLAIVPSVWPEPFGIVVIEAMTKGCPVVASATGGIVDIVVDGETGLLVPPGDATALSQALTRLLDDNVLRKSMGAASLERSQNFQAQTVVPQIEAVYNALL